MLKVGSTVITNVKTNKTGNDCVDVDVVKDGKRIRVFSCLASFYLPQKSKPFDLRAEIDAYKKAHPNTASVTRWLVKNNKTQPSMNSGDLSGLEVELLNEAHGAFEAVNAIKGALNLTSSLKLTNRGRIYGAGGRGGRGGQGGASGSMPYTTVARHIAWDGWSYHGDREKDWQRCLSKIDHTINLAGGEWIKIRRHYIWSSFGLRADWGPFRGQWTIPFGTGKVEIEAKEYHHTFKETEYRVTITLFRGEKMVTKSMTLAGCMGGGGGRGGIGRAFNRPWRQGNLGEDGCYNTAKATGGLKDVHHKTVKGYVDKKYVAEHIRKFYTDEYGNIVNTGEDRWVFLWNGVVVHTDEKNGVYYQGTGEAHASYTTGSGNAFSPQELHTYYDIEKRWVTREDLPDKMIQGKMSGQGGKGGRGGGWGQPGLKGGDGRKSDDGHKGQAGQLGEPGGPAITGARYIKKGSVYQHDIRGKVVQ